MLEIKINRKKYKITHGQVKGDHNVGSIDYLKKEICIDDKLTPYAKQEVLLHEIQHACHLESGINSTDTMTSEEFIKKTTHILFRTLYENKYWKNPPFFLIASFLVFVPVIFIGYILLPNNYCVTETGNIYNQNKNNTCAFFENKNILESLIISNSIRK